ncbi:heme A synthase [Microbacterium sp. NPDC077663]|uniref:heme A synthase n=1 Tax=Microbacterium sp. NPDC077663 TaxID=3364189 RepID=UPI0037C5DA45
MTAPFETRDTASAVGAAETPGRFRRAFAKTAGHLAPHARLLSWLSLAANILIVGTGGLVRLTASGLGCPTWPLCTEESLVNTPEMGIHGIIEFGNRLLTVVLIAIAVAAFLSVAGRRRERPDLVRLTLAIGIGIIVQAGVGGITVLLDLHPGAVGVHFILSAVLVSIAATFVYRVYAGPAGPRRTGRVMTGLVAMLVVSAVVTIYLGTLTTGAGPHAGDSAAERNGLDASVLQHFHAWPSYALLGLTVLLVSIAAWRRVPVPDPRLLLLLLGAELVQMAIGIAQARLGLPVFLVGAHMVLACVLVAALTWVVLSTRARSPRAVEAPTPGA